MNVDMECESIRARKRGMPIMLMDNQDGVKFNADVSAADLSRMLHFRDKHQELLNSVTSIRVAMCEI